MRCRWWCVAAIFLACIDPLWAGQSPASDPLVPVQEVIADVVLDVKYATADNFLHRPVYPFPAVYLRKSVAEKLRIAADRLRAQGYRLKIYDAYRPLSVQKAMWQIMPDARYVANPRNGSVHNRGGAVDCTLVKLSGQEVEMPSAFDDFSERAHHGNRLATPVARENAQRLRTAMEQAGFKAIATEWWHYQEPSRASPILDIPFEQLHQ